MGSHTFTPRGNLPFHLPAWHLDMFSNIIAVCYFGPPMFGHRDDVKQKTPTCVSMGVSSVIRIEFPVTGLAVLCTWSDVKLIVNPFKSRSKC